MAFNIEFPELQKKVHSLKSERSNQSENTKQCALLQFHFNTSNEIKEL